MLDSTTTPFLSLADDTASDARESVRYSSSVNKSFASSKKSTSSFASCYEDTRVERLEREMMSLTKRLDSEIQTRRKLQDILSQSGINLPADLNLPQE